MCGHESCTDSVYFIPPNETENFSPEKYLGKSLVEDKKDKVIADLVLALKAYAGHWDKGDRDGFGWSNGRFFYEDKFGHREDAKGPEIALKKLREYNLIE